MYREFRNYNSKAEKRNGAASGDDAQIDAFA